MARLGLERQRSVCASLTWSKDVSPARSDVLEADQTVDSGSGKVDTVG